MQEQVPSWAVTEEQLAAWGITLRKTDKVVGTKVVVQEGMTRSQAVYAAWAAGHVRMAFMPQHEANEMWRRRRERMAEEHRVTVENVNWLRERGLIHKHP